MDIPWYLRLAIFPVGLCIVATAWADQVSLAKPVERGQQVWTTGHSFHLFVPHHLRTVAESAGIKDHAAIQDPLIVSNVDVVTCSPFLDPSRPDRWLESVAERGLKHNPNIRIMAQVSWLASDSPRNQTPEQVDWNAPTIEKLRGTHAPYFKIVEDQVRALNKRHGKPVVFVVPVAQAVIALRGKIIAGQAPGLKTQDELFRDARGHAREPLQALTVYCHFATIYRRTPVGLPMSPILKAAKIPDWDEKLDRMLQELAWEAVIKEPLSGLRAAP